MAKFHKTSTSGEGWSDDALNLFAEIQRRRQRLEDDQAQLRNAILRTHEAGVSTRAIAEIAGVTSSTVSVWLRLARAEASSAAATSR